MHRMNFSEKSVFQEVYGLDKFVQKHNRKTLSFILLLLLFHRVQTYVKRDFGTLLLDLDPCLDVTCDFHCLCKAFGPYDARCVQAENCPSYQEPICSSNGTTFDNKCLFEREMCLLRLNYTVQHPGGCEGQQNNVLLT